MAEFHALPVYKAAIELERQFCASTQKTKRQLKYGKVDNMQVRKIRQRKNFIKVC